MNTSRLYAVIDIGTNSTRLMIAEVNRGAISLVEKRLIITRIGETLASSGELSEEGMNRTLDVLGQFVKIIEDKSVDEYFTFATSAVRDAKNGEDFVTRCRNRYWLTVDVLDEKREAQMAFDGASPISGAARVLDIGGGSTEVTAGSDGRLQFSSSIPIGAVRAKEMFSSDDKGMKELVRLIKKSQIEYWEDKRGDFVMSKGSSKDLFKRAKKYNGRVFGVGGTITTLCALSDGLSMRYDPRLVHGRTMTRGEVGLVAREIDHMNLGKSEPIPLLKGREDIIGYGATILMACMDGLGISSLTVSDSDSMEGYLRYQLKQAATAKRDEADKVRTRVDVNEKPSMEEKIILKTQSEIDKEEANRTEIEKPSWINPKASVEYQSAASEKGIIHSLRRNTGEYAVHSSSNNSARLNEKDEIKIKPSGNNTSERLQRLNDFLDSDDEGVVEVVEITKDGINSKTERRIDDESVLNNTEKKDYVYFENLESVVTSSNEYTDSSYQPKFEDIDLASNNAAEENGEIVMEVVEAYDDSLNAKFNSSNIHLPPKHAVFEPDEQSAQCENSLNPSDNINADENSDASNAVVSGEMSAPIEKTSTSRSDVLDQQIDAEDQTKIEQSQTMSEKAEEENDVNEVEYVNEIAFSEENSVIRPTSSTLLDRRKYAHVEKKISMEMDNDAEGVLPSALERIRRSISDALEKAKMEMPEIDEIDSEQIHVTARFRLYNEKNAAENWKNENKKMASIAEADEDKKPEIEGPNDSIPKAKSAEEIEDGAKLEGEWPSFPSKDRFSSYD